MRPSLLIIDDDEHLGVVLKRVLRGYDIILVTSAEDNLAGVAERGFDGILCDLSLPGKSGADFYRKVSDVRPGQERVVRFITGGATEIESELLISKNPAALLHKPFELDVLRHFVEDLVKQQPKPRQPATTAAR